jgi:hypothetical protein
MQWYSSPEQLAKLKLIYESDSRDGWAGVSDMTMFRMFHERFPNILQDISKPSSDRTVIDLRMNDDDQKWKMCNGIKKVTIRNRRPFVRNLRDNLEYEFLLLHFQGTSKWQMRRYVTAGSLSDWMLLTGFQILRRLRIVKSASNY